MTAVKVDEPSSLTATFLTGSADQARWWLD